MFRVYSYLLHSICVPIVWNVFPCSVRPLLVRWMNCQFPNNFDIPFTTHSTLAILYVLRMTTFLSLPPPIFPHLNKFFAFLSNIFSWQTIIVVDYDYLTIIWHIKWPQYFRFIICFHFTFCCCLFHHYLNCVCVCLMKSTSIITKKCW